MKNFLVTGCSGFIGSALSLHLLKQGHQVLGIDNNNDYYDINLKKARLGRKEKYNNFTFEQLDISDTKSLSRIFNENNIDIVINLAAQAGVRYSIDNPSTYISSNIKGFANILEECRSHKINHLIYASSSSVYGSNTKLPFTEDQITETPLSLYAASKKSNELMAYSYSNLFNFRTTGLRFFTVYGPWGRPDMAIFKFTKSILNNEKINVFNNGKHIRDFTYIDDIISGIDAIIFDKKNQISKNTEKNLSSIYNIANGKPVELLECINSIEKSLNKKADMEFLSMQPGDVLETHACINKLTRDYRYSPSTPISKGIEKFTAWYKDFYKFN